MSFISDIRKKIGHDAVFMPAAACIIVKDNKILLQHRTDNGAWAIHGGGLEFGEDVIDGLERELREELHIKPINPQMFDVYSGEDLHVKYPNGDEVYVVCIVYIVKEFEGELTPDLDEVSEVKWFDFDDLPENLHIPDIRPIYDVIDYIKNKDN